MDEFAMRDELREKRKNIKTFDELVEFLKDVEKNYGHGYGEAPRAIAQACLAVAWYLANRYGITGFQAGYVMWDFIRDWMYAGNKCGLKIVDYDNMLYPQYSYKFGRTISSDTWLALREEARNKLSESNNAHPDVKAHWERIASGVIPFGYTISNDR